MSAYDLLEDLLRAIGKLFRGAIGDIAEEGITSAADTAAGRDPRRSKKIRRGCLAVAAAVGGIVVMGILNSSETFRFVIERTSGTKAAEEFAHRDAVWTFWTCLVVLPLLSLPAIGEVRTHYASAKTRAERRLALLTGCCFLVFMLSLLRCGYNQAWGTEAAENGDLLLAGFVIFLWITIIGMTPDFAKRKSRSVWRALRSLLLIALSALAALLCGWGTLTHVVRGDW